MKIQDIDKHINEVKKAPEQIDQLLSLSIDLFLQVKIKELKYLIIASRTLFDELELKIDFKYYGYTFEALEHILASNYILAIDQLQIALSLAIGDENKIVEAIIYCINGICYRSIGESAYALFYHLKSNDIIEYNDLFSNVELMNIYQIGEIYASSGDTKEAKKFFLKSINSSLSTNSTESISFRSLSGLSNIFISEGKLKEAKNYLDKQENYSKGNYVNQSRFYSDKALYYYSLQEYSQAIIFENKSLIIRESENRSDAMATCYISLGKSYLAISDYEKVLEYSIIGLKICIENNTKNKTLSCHKLLSDIYKTIDNKELAFSHLEQYVTLTNELIIEQRKLSDKIKNKLLNSQKDMFEETLKELSSSVKYAERIQRAMLQPTLNLNKVIPESFIFFKPHSIISGDFYWFSTVDEKIIIAVGDCTGHGVSAGMLTMKGHGILTRIISESKITRPDLILNILAEKLHYDLDYENSKIEDGMDVSICTIDIKNNSILYAGAKRPLLIIDNGTSSRISGDRMSIGASY